jgi:hypothetical protein
MLDFSIRYLNVLKTQLSGLNLTNILDPDEFYQKQILDSILPYQESELFKKSVKETGVVVDVGFGGGFPILPLAKLLPEVKFVGVESRRKKAEAYALELTIQIKRAEREKKRQELETEFASVFQEVEKKRKALERLESSLADMESTRDRKDREFRRLQKNLMQLLLEQSVLFHQGPFCLSMLASSFQLPREERTQESGGGGA